MQTVTVKIIDFEEESGSLICSFASDTTQSNNPDDYRSFAFQPVLMWPEANTTEEVMAELAKCGISMCQDAERQESFKNSPDKINSYKNMVNQVKTFNVSDLLVNNSPEEQTPSVEV
jgi:hypothetical protein